MSPTEVHADVEENEWASRLRSRLSGMAEEMLVPGGVVLVRSADHGDLTMTFGTRTREGDDPVQLGDHIRVGSNTKTWTGTVVLQLAQEELLELDDPIGRYRPGVPNGDNITIAQLLAMRSGLYNYTETVEMNRILDDDPAYVFEPEELLAMAFAHKNYCEPGVRFHYSNTNTVLLGLLIEQLAGSVHDEFAKRIFEPLEMHDTVMPERASAAIPRPYARGYMYGTNLSTISTQVLPKAQQAEAMAGTLKPYDQTDGSPSWAWTAGGGISTAGDLLRYVVALVNGRLLDEPAQQARMASLQPRDPEDPDGPAYGYALARFGTFYGHTGELPGYNSFMGHDP
ncbi:MAG TPA: serine hydrolase domain-containing protein, partial [Actinomycetota bacterium]|nr:serine hydrolase domain-containing protein [Actinomycetota bacterium]